MNFVKSFFITSSTTITITVISFINNVVVTRHLGPEGRGIYTVISNLTLFFCLLFGEGIRRSNAVIVGKSIENLGKLFRFLLVHSLFLIILFSLIFSLAPSFSHLLPNITSTHLLFGLSIALFTIFWQSVQALLLGLQNIISFNLMFLVQTITIFCLNLLGVFIFNFDVNGFILSLFISAILTSLSGYFFLKKYHRFKKINSSPILGEYIKVGLKSLVSSFSMFLTLRGDIFLINFFLNPVQAGLYSVAVLFSEIVQKIPNVIGPLIISKTVVDFSNKPAMNTVRLVRVVFVFNLFVICILFFAGDLIIDFLFGVTFKKAYAPLEFLLPALFFIAPGGIIHAYLIGRAYPKAIVIINVLVASLNICLNIIFIPQFGIIAAASISSITYFLWTCSMIVYLKNQSGFSFNQIFLIRKEDVNYILKSVRIKKINS